MLTVGCKTDLVHAMLLTTAKFSISGAQSTAMSMLPSTMMVNGPDIKTKLDSEVTSAILGNQSSKDIYCPKYIECDVVYESEPTEVPAYAEYLNNTNGDFRSVSSYGNVAYFRSCNKFVFRSVATQVVDMMHTRALEHYNTYRDNAARTLKSFENEWCTYDNTVLYRSWLRNNLEFVNIYRNGLSAFDALSKETSHDKRVEFILCVAKLISAIHDKGNKKTGYVWNSVCNGPTDMWYVGSMYALQDLGKVGDSCNEGNVIHPKVTFYDEERYAPNFEASAVESTLVVGSVRSCNALSRWGSNPEHRDPDADFGLTKLGFSEVSNTVQEQCQRELIESTTSNKFILKPYIDSYRELYRACLEQELYNTITRLVNSVTHLEQRIAGAGVVLQGGIQSW